MKYFYSVIFAMLMLASCKKDANNTTSGNLPKIDTAIVGTVIIKEPPVVYDNGKTKVTVSHSCPCKPSNEIYFFSANNNTITDSLHTTYTWTINMASTFTLTGKNVQFVFDRKGQWDVKLEIKTNGVLIDNVTVTVYPYGQLANNRNVAIRADCIDTNKKYFVSIFSTELEPGDGYVDARYWDFGDGTSDNRKYVQHYFPQVPYDKTYNVQLFIHNSNGCKDSATLPVFVPASYFLNCKYTYTSTDACKPSHEVFTFTANTVGVPANAEYIWDFKDYVKDIKGNQVDHEFSFRNRYDVTLKIMYNGMQLCSSYDSVLAKGQNVTPTAFFYASLEKDSANIYRQFFNCTSKFDNGGFLIDIVWDYGDGFSEHRPKDDYNARHDYVKKSFDATYNVKMVITDTSGCKDTSSTKVFIPKL
jgi:hypothetical protein